MSKISDLIRDEGDYAEAHDNDPPLREITPARPGQAKSVMQSVRLNPDEDAAIREIAEQEGSPVSAVIRGAILDRIERAKAPVRSAEEKQAAQLEAFKVLAETSGLPAMQLAGYLQSSTMGFVKKTEPRKAAKKAQPAKKAVPRRAQASR